jgi:transposase-like protein
MGHSTDNPPLTSVQQCVVDALAAGSTLTDTAETYGVHRVTIYRWMKTSKPFAAALHRARAEFVLARRDDLHHLSNRALETLLAVLDNPKASPAVQLRAAMFILQRPQLPKTGWSMPEPAPDPDGKKLLDSAIIEQDYDSLPGLCNIEREEPVETPAETQAPAESRTSDPPPPPESPAPPAHDRSPCNQMQHDFEICDDVASAPAPRQGLHSCPVPPGVLKARNQHRQYLDLLDMIKAIEQTPVPKIENIENDDAPQPATRHPNAKLVEECP